MLTADQTSGAKIIDAALACNIFKNLITALLCLIPLV
jgi:hypothetical protein